jgi:hypothetical protein
MAATPRKVTSRIPGMRTWVVIASVALVLAGCDRRAVVKRESEGKRRTVRLSLLQEKKSWSSQGPSGTIDYNWPYATMSTGGHGAPGEWASGLAYDLNLEKPYDVEIRIFDAEEGAIRVEVNFAGPPSPDLASITFEHLTKVDRIVEIPKEGGAERPCGSWALQGVVFELRAPEAPAKISFIAKSAAR